ncbi:MFS general substrate transporter [Aspergillus steynii IBT 23096]|uniref:MFS general substrate transporter n=1 Tax=Aspergillus steynii IBT 23096 TaxID=1392250 RepID=A0A2I2GAL3_9EURO|nr:MFS general substrate transporter [Aspergillus steynii IBT 23096]PLB49898.1 MFS general substrate transporter [Aspergillus steynii IBT 23096]
MCFQNAFGVFQEPHGQNILQKHSELDIAWIGSLLTCTLFFSATLAGIFADRLGPTIPLAIGSIGTLIAIFMTSLCDLLYQFLLTQGLLLGISNAFLLCPAMAIVSHLFDRHQSVASGIMISGSSIRGILALQESEKETENTSTERNNKSKDSAALVRNPAFVLLCGSLSLATFGLFSPLFFLSTYAVSQGLSSRLAFYIVSILNRGSLVGRVSMGIFADRYGNFNLCFLIGALSGYYDAIFSLQTPCAVQLASPKSKGALIGIILIAPAIPGLIDTPISGQLIKQSYLALSMFSGAMLLAGSMLVLYIRLRQSRKLFVKV